MSNSNETGTVVWCPSSGHQWARENNRVQAEIKLDNGDTIRVSAPESAAFAEPILALEPGQRVSVYLNGKYWNLSKFQPTDNGQQETRPHNGTVPAKTTHAQKEKKTVEELIAQADELIHVYKHIYHTLGEGAIIDDRAHSSMASTIFIELMGRQ